MREPCFYSGRLEGTGIVSGHAGVLLAANNRLDGDDGFKHTDPDPSCKVIAIVHGVYAIQRSTPQ